MQANIFKELTPEETDRIRDRLYIITIGMMAYVLYTEKLSEHERYIEEHFEERASLYELLDYCKEHNIKIVPIPLGSHVPDITQENERITAYNCQITDKSLIDIIIRCVFQNLLPRTPEPPEQCNGCINLTETAEECFCAMDVLDNLKSGEPCSEYCPRDAMKQAMLNNLKERRAHATDENEIRQLDQLYTEMTNDITSPRAREFMNANITEIQFPTL